MLRIEGGGASEAQPATKKRTAGKVKTRADTHAARAAGHGFKLKVSSAFYEDYIQFLRSPL